MDSPEMATLDAPLPVLESIKGVKRAPLEEYFTSGHRTCQGCESALVMKLMVKAAGPRTVVLGSTGCMYVANTTYYSSPGSCRGCTRSSDRPGRRPWGRRPDTGR